MIPFHLAHYLFGRGIKDLNGDGRRVNWAPKVSTAYGEPRLASDDQTPDRDKVFVIDHAEYDVRNRMVLEL